MVFLNLMANAASPLYPLAGAHDMLCYYSHTHLVLVANAVKMQLESCRACLITYACSNYEVKFMWKSLFIDNY